MRQFFLIFIYLLVITCSFGQTNPEDIIIKYNSDGSKEIINKNDLSTDPDSVDSMLLSEVEEMYLMRLDSLEVLNRLVGKWTFTSAQRTNGRNFKSGNTSSYEFKRDGTFVSIYADEKLEGKWTVHEGGNAVINLAYDKPKVLIKDKNVLKYLDKETLKSVTFSSEVISFVTINSTSMTIRSSTIVSDPKGVNDTFYRIILLNYDKSMN